MPLLQGKKLGFSNSILGFTKDIFYILLTLEKYALVDKSTTKGL